jgi:signal peptidase I
VSPDLTIEKTLRDLAGAGAPTVAATPLLAERVLTLHARSARRRRIGASLALAGLVAGGAVAARSGGESRFFSVYEPSTSMEPTLAEGEHLIVDRTLTAARGDLVELELSSGSQTVRRVIGLPGDVIACPAGDDGYCHGWTRNGAVLAEPYIGRDHGSPAPGDVTPGPGFFLAPGSDSIVPYAAVTVSAGQLFELGDNRDNAVDSRLSGLVALDGIDGVGVEVVGTDGRHRAIPGAPPHEVPGPGGTVDPPGAPPTGESAPVVTQPTS